MEETIIKHIEQELAQEEIEDGLEASEDLLGSGILDSMAMVKLIAFIEDTFEINVLPEEMIIENFMNVEAIVNYISSKK